MVTSAIIMTDCSWDELESENRLALVRSESIPESLAEYYRPFFLNFEVGSTDGFKKICKKIDGDENSITVQGVIMVGRFPRPFTKEYTVGESFTIAQIDPDHEGDDTDPISPVVTDIFLVKNEKDEVRLAKKFKEYLEEWRATNLPWTQPLSSTE